MGALTTQPITVAQHVDEEHHLVTVSLADHVDVITGLARAIHHNPHLAEAFRVIGTNTGSTGVGQHLVAGYLRDLLTDRQIRDALTPTIDPDAASQLAEQLEDAALEPRRCDICKAFAISTDGFCRAHAQYEVA